MKKLALHWKIIIGLLLGVLWAVLSSHFGWSQFTKDWIDPFGKIFINLLKLIAVPLVLFSIISGITGLSDVSSLGRMGAKTLVAYLVTTVFAVSVGLILVNTIQPGKFIPEQQRLENRLRYEQWASEKGLTPIDGKNYTAENSSIELSEEKVDEGLAKTIQEKEQTAKETTEAGPLKFLVDMVPNNIFISLGNNKLMLQVIFFALFFGVTLLLLEKSKVQVVIDFINGSNEVFLKMVDITMLAAPYFVFALMAGKMSDLAGDDPSKLLGIFQSLGIYSLTVVIGLFAMIFIIYPTIKILLTKRDGVSFGQAYATFFRNIGPAQMLAFSTSSSAATLPVTMECVTDNMKVKKEITSFVLPIGATVNMDGTSLYQAVAVVFLAQFHMVELDMMAQLTIVLTATLASIGSAAVPSAGLVMLMIVLDSLGLNPAWIAIIFPIDRILDMCRTVVNVTGDATVCAVIAGSEKQLNEE